MPFVKGHVLSEEARAKLRASKAGKKIGPHSAERIRKIAESNRGKVRAKKFSVTCACGTTIATGSNNAKFCSEKCRKASYGHGLRHAPQFMAFPKICAICGSGQALVGDHDHATGKPRGILCRNCNLALGNMGDNPARLRAAAAYLEAQQ